MKEFNDLFSVLPTKKYQIKSDQIQPEGNYPVIDQGQQLIAGFSDEFDELFDNVPVVIFGDHTTFVKYIDFDFIVGADGTKILKPTNDNSLKFLYYTLEFCKINPEGYKRHFSILKRLKLKIPTTNEQQKIADFLTAVDERIGKLEKKKGLFEKYKKGVMQNLFPAKGEINPKIRFRPAPDSNYPDWVEKKLGEITSFHKGSNIPKESINLEGETECILYGELYTTYTEVIRAVKSRTIINTANLVMSKMNDVIIPSSGETSIDIAKSSCVLKNDIALGADLNILRGDFDGIFLAYYISNAKRLDIAKLAQGQSVVHLYSSHLQNLKVAIPNIEEQQKIADFLTSLDNKVELINNKLEQAKEFKKGLLQKMFV